MRPVARVLREHRVPLRAVLAARERRHTEPVRHAPDNVLDVVLREPVLRGCLRFLTPKQVTVFLGWFVGDSEHFTPLLAEAFRDPLRFRQPRPTVARGLFRGGVKVVLRDLRWLVGVHEEGHVTNALEED